jgi:hypothetical protein
MELEHLDVSVSQVIRYKPDTDLIIELVKCFGLEGLNDTSKISKYSMQDNNTIEQIIEMIPTLMIYMYPCKAKYFLTDIKSYTRCITLLKHFLIKTPYKIIKSEKIINNELKARKVIYYSLTTEYTKKVNIKLEKIIISLN